MCNDFGHHNAYPTWRCLVSQFAVQSRCSPCACCTVRADCYDRCNRSRTRVQLQSLGRNPSRISRRYWHHLPCTYRPLPLCRVDIYMSLVSPLFCIYPKAYFALSTACTCAVVSLLAVITHTVCCASACSIWVGQHQWSANGLKN